MNALSALWQTNKGLVLGVIGGFLAICLACSAIAGLASFGLTRAANPPAPTQALEPAQTTAPATTPTAPAPPPTPIDCQTLDYGSFEVYTVPNNYEPKVYGLYVVQENEIAALWWGVKKINNESFDLSKAGNYRGYWFGPGEYFLEGNGRFRKWRNVPQQCYQALKNWWQSMPELSGSNPPYLWKDVSLP